MSYAADLQSTILSLGNQLGALDPLSRKVIGILLEELVANPSHALNIAAKATALTTAQHTISRNQDLNRAPSRQG